MDLCADVEEDEVLSSAPFRVALVVFGAVRIGNRAIPGRAGLSCRESADGSNARIVSRGFQVEGKALV